MKKCKLCNKDIPSRTIVNGVSKCTHKRIYCLECSPFGSGFKKLICRKRTTKVCYKCKKEKALSNFWKRKRGLGDHDVNAMCKDCCFLRQHNSREDAKIKYVEYKGGKCEICGYCKCFWALDFHHKDPSKKDFGISKIRKADFTAKIKEELDKCILLCSNCHRERHYEETKRKKAEIILLY